MSIFTFVRHTLPANDVVALGSVSPPDRFLELDVVQCTSKTSCTATAQRDSFTIIGMQSGYEIKWAKTGGGTWSNVYSIVAANCPTSANVNYAEGCVRSAPTYFSDTPLPEPSADLGIVIGALLVVALFARRVTRRRIA